MKDDRVYLRHILDAVEAIAEYTVGGEQVFLENRLVRDGVVRNLEIIGEAVKNLSPGLRADNPEIPWTQIAGLRDVLIHQYFGVDSKIVWLVVKNRLPALREHIKMLLDR